MHRAGKILFARCFFILVNEINMYCYIFIYMKNILKNVLTYLLGCVSMRNALLR